MSVRYQPPDPEYLCQVKPGLRHNAPCGCNVPGSLHWRDRKIEEDHRAGTPKKTY